MQRDLIAQILQGPFQLVSKAVSLVSHFDRLPTALIIGGVGLSILNHPFHFTLGEIGGFRNGDRLFFAGFLVPGGDVEDAVGIDIESHLDLGQSAGRRPNPFQSKAAEYPVVFGQFPFALQHRNVHCRLVVLGRRKDLLAS